MVTNLILKLFKQKCHKDLSWAHCYFLLYINALPTSSNYFKMIRYTDDTTLYCNIKNREDCEDTINNALSNIHQWLTSNKVSLNIKKTTFMIFH